MSSKSTSCLSVISTIKGWIDSGDLLPGGAIPPEREISKRLSTQRITVRGALASLEEEGIVRRIGPRTRIVAERSYAMEHSIVIVNSAKHQWLVDRMHMPGWAVMVSVGALAQVGDSGHNLTVIHPEHITPVQLRKLITGRPAGVVFPELNGEYAYSLAWLEPLTKAGIPVAVYGNAPELSGYDRVCSDHEAGSYMLTRHLIEQGRRRPLMFYAVPAAYEQYWVAARRAGYERAMTEAGLQPLPMVCCGPTPIIAAPGTAAQFDSERRHALSYLIDHVGSLAQGPQVDALCVASDGDIYGASAACRTLGVTVGQDIVLAGYDNYWIECWERNFESVSPIATVDKRLTDSGRQMVQLICDRANKKLPDSPHVVVVQPELVVIRKNKSQENA